MSLSYKYGIYRLNFAYGGSQTANLWSQGQALCQLRHTNESYMVIKNLISLLLKTANTNRIFYSV